MTNKTTHDVLIGQTDGGFFAASTEAPYFCFQAETEEAVKDKVRQAFGFYHMPEAADQPRPQRAKQRVMNTFTPSKRVPRREFEGVAA